eukprot:3542147-Amphidinium_carterae.1
MRQATWDNLLLNLSQVNSINATLFLDDQYKDRNSARPWAVLIDTGALTSVAPRHHFNHIPEYPQSLTSVNGESLQIYGVRLLLRRRDMR